MQFDLFGRGRVVIGLRAAGSAKGNFWLGRGGVPMHWDWVKGGEVSKRELLGLAHVSSPSRRGWVRVRSIESGTKIQRNSGA